MACCSLTGEQQWSPHFADVPLDAQTRTCVGDRYRETPRDVVFIDDAARARADLGAPALSTARHVPLNLVQFRGRRGQQFLAFVRPQLRELRIATRDRPFAEIRGW